MFRNLIQTHLSKSCKAVKLMDYTYKSLSQLYLNFRRKQRIKGLWLSEVFIRYTYIYKRYFENSDKGITGKTIYYLFHKYIYNSK